MYLNQSIRPIHPSTDKCFSSHYKGVCKIQLLWLLQKMWPWKPVECVVLLFFFVCVCEYFVVVIEVAVDEVAAVRYIFEMKTNDKSNTNNVKEKPAIFVDHFDCRPAGWLASWIRYMCTRTNGWCSTGMIGMKRFAGKSKHSFRAYCFQCNLQLCKYCCCCCWSITIICSHIFIHQLWTMIFFRRTMWTVRLLHLRIFHF